MRASAIIALIGAATLQASLPRPAQAWGPDGHAIIAIIAENRLTPEARQTVKAMLDDASLASVSNWADEIRPLRRETSRWHYVNFADGSKDYIPSRDCQLVPGQGDCILAAIDRAIVDLNKDGGSVDALKFLVHFVGDVHQPFHAVGFERGGNGIRVIAFGNRTNLHSVWDGVMVKQAGRTPEAYANYLEKEWLQGRDLAALSTGTATEWALASRVLGESAIVPQESALGVSYYEQFVPIVDQQLALAGIRLARILNGAFR